MMASLKDVRRGRRDSQAAALVAAALKRLQESSWMAEFELRELPEVRAILDFPGELRWECVLDVAGRRDGCGCVRLLSVIACKRVELTDVDVEALLSPARAKLEPYEAWLRSQTVRALNRRIEHAYSGLNDDGKARLKPWLERVASEVDHPPTATEFGGWSAAASRSRASSSTMVTMSVLACARSSRRARSRAKPARWCSIC